MLTVSLYPYQDEPVDQFLDRGNLLVAYEMGLGKTAIAIAAAEELLGEEIDCCLIVCPANLKWQWAQALVKFTDVDTTARQPKRDKTITVPTDEYCVVVDGGPKKRQELYALIADQQPEYIVMSYETVVNDWKWVRRIKPGMIVLDEATAIKTFRAQRTKKIKKLTAPYRMALTGTPVENRPEELFSIMQWVDESVLGRYDLFDKAYVVRNNFGGVQRYKNLGVLHTRLAPALCRRNRRDPAVAPYLPDVDGDVWEVDMDKGTRQVYRTIAADLLAELRQLRGGEFDVDAYYSGDATFGMDTQAGKVMAMQQALEMYLDHPFLVEYSAHDYADRSTQRGSKYAATLLDNGTLAVDAKPKKLERLVEEMDKILAYPDNKVIIFTKYVDMLTIIEGVLPRGICVKYHGGMNAQEKAAAVAEFTDNPGCRVFLSSHAGAYGTDLFMANYLVNYDLPWSAGKADQINGRHVRASSEFDKVYVRDMVTMGTIEERKHRLISFKRRIGSAILDQRGQDEMGRVENDLGTLTDHLAAVLDT